MVTPYIETYQEVKCAACGKLMRYRVRGDLNEHPWFVVTTPRDMSFGCPPPEVAYLCPNPQCGMEWFRRRCAQEAKRWAIPNDAPTNPSDAPTGPLSND